MKPLTLVVAAAALASLIAATPDETQAKSPFCFAGSPTPKHVCDALKAAETKKPVRAAKHDTAKNAIGNVR